MKSSSYYSLVTTNERRDILIFSLLAVTGWLSPMPIKLRKIGLVSETMHKQKRSCEFYYRPGSMFIFVSNISHNDIQRLSVTQFFQWAKYCPTLFQAFRVTAQNKDAIFQDSRYVRTNFGYDRYFMTRLELYYGMPVPT